MDLTLPCTFVKEFHCLESVQKMEYRKLGKTDLSVSKLSLGGGPFGEIFGDCEPVTPIVLEALKNGVNYIDTAYWYGQGKSEEGIGEALQHVPRSAYYIATKVCRYEKDLPRMFDFSAQKVFQSIDASLARLKLPYVDVIQIHDLEFAPNEEIILTETLPALEKVKNSGKARYIGITGYPLSALLSIIEKSTVKIDVILSYCRATMNDSTLSSYIPEFEKWGIGIISAAPTSLGLLADQGPPIWHPAQLEIREACQKAKTYCKSQGVSLSRLAGHYGIHFPGVHTTLCGANRLEHLKENLESSLTELSPLEKQCLDFVMNEYFHPLENMNWEGIELMKHKKKMGLQQ